MLLVVRVKLFGLFCLSKFFKLLQVVWLVLNSSRLSRLGCALLVVIGSFQVVSRGVKWWVDSFGFGCLTLFKPVLAVISCF